MQNGVVTVENSMGDAQKKTLKNRTTCSPTQTSENKM
jgi:hypothetical protein